VLADAHGGDVSGLDVPETIQVFETAAGVDQVGPETGIPGAVSVAFSAVIPVETPADATVRLLVTGHPAPLTLDCGVATTVCAATFEFNGPFTTTWHLELTRGDTSLVALDLEGKPIGAQTLMVAEDSTSFSLSDRVARWGPAEGASEFALAFVVRAPARTPSDEGLFVSGGAPELGDWDGRGVALVPARQGTYAAVVDIAGRRSVAFKVTRGSWYSVEKNADFSEIEDRRADLGGGLERVEIQVAAWADLALQGTGTYTGDVRVLRGVNSTELDNARDLVVWLPAGYRDSSGSRYPLMILHDGQNTMDAGSSFSGVEWGADEALGGRIAAGAIGPVIAVAVANTSGRNWEYTPWQDATYGGGGAEAYGRFLVDEVLPLIHGHYRTKTDAGSTGLVGSSLGGLATMWLGLSYPEVFGRLGVVSPSVWWDNREILDFVAAYDGPSDARIWLDTGTAEGDGTTTVNNTRALRDALVSRGWELGTELIYREYEGAGHNEEAWAARFGDLLTGLWAP